MESSGREFKLQFNNHNQSFKNRENSNKTESSKYIWQLNENHIIFNLEWYIVVFTFPCKCGTHRYKL